MSIYDIFIYIMGCFEDLLHSPISGYIFFGVFGACILFYLLYNFIRFLIRFLINNND